MSRPSLNLFALALTMLLPSVVLAGVGSVVECSIRLEALINQEKKSFSPHCREFAPKAKSVFNKKNGMIHVDDQGKLTQIKFPTEELRENLRFQYVGPEIEEGFYNSDRAEWVIFGYKGSYGEKTVAVIDSKKMSKNDVILELISSTNNIVVNTSFVDDKIVVVSDDGKKTLTLKNLKPSQLEMANEGLELFFQSESQNIVNILPGVDVLALTKQYYDQCKTNSDCIHKATSKTRKDLSKKFKKEKNKEAVAYLKHYDMSSVYFVNQYSEYINGCVYNSKNCENQLIYSGSFYRHTYDLDRGMRFVSLAQLEQNFSLFFAYLYLGPLKETH